MLSIPHKKFQFVDFEIHIKKKKKKTYRSFFVNRFYDKLLIIERDISNFAPREANLWCQP